MKHLNQLAETAMVLTLTATGFSVASNVPLAHSLAKGIQDVATATQLLLPFLFPPGGYDAGCGADPSHVTRACLHCGTLFSVPVAKKKGRKQIYCSHRCALKFYASHVRDKAAHSRKITTYFQECPERRILATTKRSAKSRGLLFDLTEEWVQVRF